MSYSSVKQYFAYIDHRMPSHALIWESGARDNWKGRESWHVDAINSRGFTDNKRSINREKMPPRVEALIKQNMSCYEYMCGQLLQPYRLYRSVICQLRKLTQIG
jgi:hypothetical protein